MALSIACNFVHCCAGITSGKYVAEYLRRVASCGRLDHAKDKSEVDEEALESTGVLESDLEIAE